MGLFSCENRTKKEQSKEQTKRKLMDAALTIFAKKGFDAASTKLVAQKAKVNEALIYRYFGDKAGLLLAVIIDVIQNTSNTADQFPPGKTVEEEIRNCLMTHYEQDLKNKQFLRVAISRSLVDAKMRKKIMDHVPVNGSPVLLERLRGHQQRGAISKEVELETLSFNVCVASVGLMFMGVAMEALTDKEANEAISALASSLTPRTQ